MVRGLAIGRLLAILFLAQVPVPSQAADDSASASYEKARRYYYDLKANASRQRYRHNWLKVIRAFKAIAARHPNTAEAPRAAFTTAELWRGLHAISGLGADLDQALLAYERVPGTYGDVPPGKQPLADDALYHRVRILLNRGERIAAAREVRRLLATYPTGDMIPAARKLARQVEDVKLPKPQSGPEASPEGRQIAGRGRAGTRARVEEAKVWTHGDYTRVAVYLSAGVQARSGQLPDADGKPGRLYVDLRGAECPPRVPGAGDAEDPVLARLRVAQFKPSTVRVAMDLEVPVNHRLMVMEGPHRVVIDLFPRQGGPESPAATRPGAKPDAPAAPVAKSEDRPHVVLDPGHGGHDGGAHAKGGLEEKEVVLDIARRTAKTLEASGLRVTLTRTDDTYLGLDERTALANSLGADVFVSIHANSNANATARGIETYYLDVTDDRYSLRLASVENQTSEDQVSELQLILTDLSTKAHTQESMVLAKRLQKELVGAARRHNRKARNLGVKGSLFYVLLGARMPAVLVETSFLSNPKEAKLLSSEAYRAELAEALARGVREHLQAPTAVAQP